METTIGRLLYLTHRTVHDELDRRLSEHGASLWNWVLLKEAAHAEGASQRELASHMGIEPPTLERDVEVLTHALPRINAYFEQRALNHDQRKHDQSKPDQTKEVSDARR